MKTEQFKTPILLVLFNRPDTTQIVFEAVRKLKPAYLYIAADGPRPSRPEDEERCRLVREIISRVDWPCEVRTLFQEKNLGCKYGESTAFNWFFTNVEAGIILEDDCLPEQSFFPYCAELLEKYKDDARIMHISGRNLQTKNKDFVCDESYYFSTVPQGWGWASWRRAWKLYDVEVKSWPQVKASHVLNKIFQDEAVTAIWEYKFQQYYEQKINSWDGQWTYACLVNHGLCIMPRVNLISNIGFSKDATHTTMEEHESAYEPTTPIEIPLKHPNVITVNRAADKYTFMYAYCINRYWNQKVRWFFKSKFPKYYLMIKNIYNRFI